MREQHNHDFLSFGDALFLHLEREGMPLNVASGSFFEGEIALADCMSYIASRLPLLPRYRQRVVFPPLALSAPSWEFDPDFDLKNHVRELRLERGTEAEVRGVASRLLSTTLDRNRPLWDFTLLSGVKANRTAVICRLHHCLADGISGVGLLKVLMDSKPDVPNIPKTVHVPHPRRVRDPATMLVDGAVSACFSTVERLLNAQAEVLEFAHHMAENGTENHNGSGNGLWGELGEVLPELAAPTERLPFNVVCRGPQKFYWTEVPLHDLKVIKHACGATVNDVVLALVSSAIRRYVEQRGVSLRGRSLRIVVPVSLRGHDDQSELGNRITFVPVTIPLGSRKACRLLQQIHQRTAVLKHAHLAELVSLAGTLLGAVPTPLQALVGPIASQLPLAVCNLICTNVPGPQWPLYLLGHKMLSCYPYVPIGGEMGMNVAVLTYDGTAYFGFTADVHAAPDVALLPRLLQQCFAELKAGARVVRRTAKPERDNAMAAAAS